MIWRGSIVFPTVTYILLIYKRPKLYWIFTELLSYRINHCEKHFYSNGCGSSLSIMFIFLVLSYSSGRLQWTCSFTYISISHSCLDLLRSSNASSKRAFPLSLINILLSNSFPLLLLSSFFSFSYTFHSSNYSFLCNRYCSTRILWKPFRFLMTLGRPFKFIPWISTTIVPKRSMRGWIKLWIPTIFYKISVSVTFAL